MSLLLGPEPFQKFGVGGGGGQKAFCFGPNLGLILEAGTKLNNYSQLVHIFPIFDQIKDKIAILGPFIHISCFFETHLNFVMNHAPHRTLVAPPCVLPNGEDVCHHMPKSQLMTMIKTRTTKVE